MSSVASASAVSAATTDPSALDAEQPDDLRAATEIYAAIQGALYEPKAQTQVAKRTFKTATEVTREVLSDVLGAGNPQVASIMSAIRDRTRSARPPVQSAEDRKGLIGKQKKYRAFIRKAMIAQSAVEIECRGCKFTAEKRPKRPTCNLNFVADQAAQFFADDEEKAEKFIEHFTDALEPDGEKVVFKVDYADPDAADAADTDGGADTDADA